MISCPHCREKLSEFLDETLPPNLRADVVAHLKSCAECASIAREVGNLRSALREIAPIAAPTSLRHNVRAALQKEAESHSSKPTFAWRPAQFAWTGTLALGALTLMILARPFSQVPISQSPIFSPQTETPSILPEAVKATDSGKIPAKSRATAAPNVQSQKKLSPARRKNPDSDAAAPQPFANPIQGTAPAPFKARIESPATPRRSESASDFAPQQSAEATKMNTSTKGDRQSQPFVEPIPPSAILGQKAPIQRPNRTTPSPAQPDAQRAIAKPRVLLEPSQKGMSNGEKIAGSIAASRKVAPREKDARPDAKQSQNVLPQDAVSVPNNARDGEFIFALQAAPSSPLAKDSPIFRSRMESSAILNDSVDGATKKTEKFTAKRAGAGFGAPNPVPEINSFRTPNALTAPQLNAPRANSPQSESAQTRSVLPMGVTARRFELQIEAPRALKDAQIRLELPDSVRLLWPASSVIWRGDFAVGKAVRVEFSLSQGRGEKISVILEQKTEGAQSRPLQTQTLVLPASNP